MHLRLLQVPCAQLHVQEVGSVQLAVERAETELLGVGEMGLVLLLSQSVSPHTCWYYCMQQHQLSISGRTCTYRRRTLNFNLLQLLQANKLPVMPTALQIF